MKEQRSIQRQRALKGARIMFNQSASSITCLVRDLTSDGARLVVESPIGIPDEFQLVFDDGPRARTCKVMWKLPGAIGVRFL
jgi:hypothetical protein